MKAFGKTVGKTVVFCLVMMLMEVKLTNMGTLQQIPKRR